MSAIEVKSAAVSFPIAVADTTGVTGVHRITGIAAAGSVELPAGMKGKFLRVQPIGGDAQVALSFGASAGQTLVLNQASVAGTGHAAAGATVKDGAFLDGVVPTPSTKPGKVWLNYINVSGTISLEFWCSEAVKPV